MIQSRLLDYGRASPADSQGVHRRLSKRGASAGNGVLDQCVSATVYVIPWIVPALLSLDIKRYVMTEERGFVFAARYFGRIPIERPGQGLVFPLTHMEKLSFFRMDILVGLLLVPLVLAALVRYLPCRWRFPTIAFLSLGVSTALYAQLRALGEIGRYMTFRMLWTALSWGWHEPSANAGYLKGKAVLLVLLAGVFFIGSVLWLGMRRHTELARSAEQRWRIPGSTALSCLLLVSALSWLPRVPRTSYHASALLGALNAFWLEGDVETKEFAGLSVPGLLSRYRELTHAPLSQKDPRYWGKAKGCNVLFIVLETAPASFLPAEDKLDDFPNLRRLRSKSFVGKRHYTTYPHTHEAFFSLFSSWYPSGLMKSFERQHPDMAVPGIMHTLSSLGYHTATYAPATWGGELDPEMFRELGFQQEVYPDSGSLSSLASGYDLSDWKGTRVGRDVAGLNLMKLDLERWLTKGDKFAAVFLPQIGHAPWPDAPQSGDENNIPKRGRAILARQDAWLGELLQLLERHRQLQQTLIVIVGDHGIRMRYEDPSSGVGTTIDDYGFHVPLTIYAPQALDNTEMISWATSHIDVAPTLLDLLGIEQGRDFEQGTAIWNPDLVKRTTYFFALHTLGADGYYSNGRFFMWSHNSDLVATNVRMHFDPSDFVLRDSPTYLEVTRSIARMVGLQQVWATQFGQKESLRKHLYTSTVR